MTLRMFLPQVLVLVNQKSKQHQQLMITVLMRWRNISKSRRLNKLLKGLSLRNLCLLIKITVSLLISTMKTSSLCQEVRKTSLQVFCLPLSSLLLNKHSIISLLTLLLPSMSRRRTVQPKQMKASILSCNLRIKLPPPTKNGLSLKTSKMRSPLSKTSSQIRPILSKN